MSSIAQAFRVLDSVAKTQPVGVSALARAIGLPKTTAYRILKSLEEVGWVRKRHDSGAPQWVLTAAPLILSQYVAQDSHLRELALPVMERLRDQWTEAVHLAVPQNDGIVVISQVEAHQAVRIHWPLGQLSSAQVSANGRAILAFSSGQQAEELYPKDFKAYTDRTITSTEAFDQELAQIQADGFAVVQGEQRSDITSVAAPVFQSGRNPVGSLSLFMPSYRFLEDKIGELGGSLTVAAQEIGDRLRGR